MSTESPEEEEQLRELTEEGKTAEEILEDNEETLDKWVADFFIRYEDGVERFKDLDVLEKAEYLIKIIENEEEEPYKGLEFEEDTYDIRRIAQLASIDYLPIISDAKGELDEFYTLGGDGNIVVGSPGRANDLEKEYDLENKPNIFLDPNAAYSDRE